MRPTRDQKRFTVSKLVIVAERHEVQRTMRPSIACVIEHLTLGAARRHSTVPISHIRFSSTCDNYHPADERQLSIDSPYTPVISAKSTVEICVVA